MRWNLSYKDILTSIVHRHLLWAILQKFIFHVGYPIYGSARKSIIEVQLFELWASFTQRALQYFLPLPRTYLRIENSSILVSFWSALSNSTTKIDSRYTALRALSHIICDWCIYYMRLPHIIIICDCCIYYMHILYTFVYAAFVYAICYAFTSAPPCIHLWCTCNLYEFWHKWHP